ncbi:ankyrin repeat family protein [Orientia chuto str. Dubai]|uniref:Ankyrin repeat family protein n=1 Tax=Orientia chuto str. Dubai TaxID=1359168 RepID=A0A0F3MJ51_9RICK|nr:ankyrin repeat domain-containing protein [Candidatus Orientia mediorientalis]KJV55798.1 ankyrin repeat family protein [Orientia chuto str. Dubai]
MHFLLRYILSQGYRVLRRISILLSNAENNFDHEDHSIHQAAKCGDAETVKCLIAETKINVNLKDNKGMTPLHYAVARGWIQVVEVLLKENSIDVNLENPLGMTPLHYAVCSKNINIVKRLLAAPDIISSARDSDGATACHYAASLNCLEIVKLLMNTCSIIDYSGKNAVHCAAENGNVEIVQYLLEYGRNIDVNLADARGCSALHYACSGTSKLKLPSLIKLLLEHGTNIDSQNLLGETALHISTSKGYIDAIKTLIQHGSNINLQNNTGDTIMHIAAEKAHINVVKYLLNIDMDINMQDHLGFTPLMVCPNNHAGNQIIELFIAHIVASKHCNKSYCTNQSCIQDSEKFRINEEFINGREDLVQKHQDMWSIKDIEIGHDLNIYNLYYLPENIDHRQLQYAHYYTVENCYRHCEAVFPTVAKCLQDNIKRARLTSVITNNSGKIEQFYPLPYEIREKIFMYLKLPELEAFQSALLCLDNLESFDSEENLSNTIAGEYHLNQNDNF